MLHVRQLTRRTVMQGLAALGLPAACRQAGGPPGTGDTQPTKKPVRLVFEWPEYTPPKKAWAE